MTIKKVIAVLLLLICMLATFCQIFTSIAQYLRYDTTITTAYINGIYSDELPSVTLCGQKSDFITDTAYEKLFERSLTRPITPEDSDVINKDLSDKPVKDQLAVMLSAEDLKQYIGCRMPVADGYPGQTEDCTQSMTIRTSLSADFFCFTLTHVKDQSEYRRYGRNSIYWLSIQVKLQLTDLMVSLHDKSETLHDLLRNDVQAIRLEPKKTTNLYFSTLTIKRLPNPYNTMCRHSAEEECNFNFYTKLWLDNVGCLPDHYLYNSSQSSTFCGNIAIGEDKARELTRRKNYDYMCRNPCHREYYRLNAVPVISDQSSPDGHTLNVLAAKEPNPIIVYHPFMTLGDLGAQMSNMVCLWFAGLALYLLGRLNLDNTLTKVHSIT